MSKTKTIELYGFAYNVTVPDVKRFVEQYTGEGSVVAMKIRECKGHTRKAFAVIQFTTAKHATYMMALPNRTSSPFRYRNSYLKLREMERDIDPKLRDVLDSLDNVKMYFGNQISKERFSVLWRNVDVCVDFGIGMRKLKFSMCHNDRKFKLELSYENIWKIELHRLRDKTGKYLLIQVVKFNFFIKCISFLFFM